MGNLYDDDDVKEKEDGETGDGFQDDLSDDGPEINAFESPEEL